MDRELEGQENLGDDGEKIRSDTQQGIVMRVGRTDQTRARGGEWTGWARRLQEGNETRLRSSG